MDLLQTTLCYLEKDGAKTIAKEQSEELYRKTFIPLKAKSDATKKFGTTDTANDVIVTDNKDAENGNPEPLAQACI